MTSTTFPAVIFIALMIISYPVINTIREINNLQWIDPPFRLWHYITLALLLVLLEVFAQSMINAINKKSEYGP